MRKQVSKPEVMQPPSPLLTPEQAAGYLHISEGALYRMMRVGKIAAVQLRGSKLRKTLRYRREDVFALLVPVEPKG